MATTCLAVELTDAEQALRLGTQGGGNWPSIAIVAPAFADGVIEAWVAGELTGRGAPDDRGFVGLSFHIGDGFLSHETVYLRMTNGRLNVPPPPAPRIDRAIQYVADPGFHFSQSRAAFPGRYEKGADIALGRWHRLRLAIQGARLGARSTASRRWSSTTCASPAGARRSACSSATARAACSRA